MQTKVIFPLGLFLVAFVWVSLFDHRIPASIQSVLFFAVLLLELLLIGAGWRYFVRNNKTTSIVAWRKRTAFIAVLANTIAFAIPLGALLYMISYPSIGLRMGLPMVNGEKMILGCLAFSVLGVVAGILSPAKSRFASVLGNVIIALLVLAIPMAIL